MAQLDRQHYALQTIFSFFLGLMVLAFVGVGVNTFYPQPSNAYQKQLEPLYQRQSEITSKGVEPTGTAAAELASIQKQISDLEQKSQDAMKGWGLNTSIILVLFATAVMGVSLVRSDQLRVLSNGLLLGGLFIMLYGMGWTIASDTTGYSRFVVVVFALAVALALGYVKFVRMRAVGAPQATAAAVTAGDMSEIENRVAALESKLGAVAAVFASDREGGDKPV